MIETVFQELRRAERSLAQTPALTATVAATLSLGISTCAVFFGFVEGIWTRPLPGVDQPTQLVHVSSRSRTSDVGGLSYPDVLEMRERTRSFASLAATQRRQPLVYGEGFVDATMSNVVSDGYFTTLGVRTEVGRLFTERDAGSPSTPVLVMSHSYWQRRYSGDPTVVGKSIRVNNDHFTVIGVAGRDFRGTELWTDTDLWIPMTSWKAISPGDATLRQGNEFEVMGRLRPGVSLQEARVEAEVFANALASAYPATNKGRMFVLETDRHRRFHNAGSAPVIVLVLVGLVLMIACANATNLLLARAEARRRLTATHIALGCTRWRLAGHALAESAVLVTLAAIAALIVANWGVGGFGALLSPPDPRFRNEFYLDGRVTLFTLMVSAIAVVLASLAPVLRARSVDVAGAMRGEQPGARPRSRAGSLLVGVQMAGAMVLSALAVLFLRSLINVERADLGFERKGVLAVTLSAPYESSRTHATYGALLDRVRALPQVKQACLASRAPLSGSGGGRDDEILIPGREDPRSESPLRVRLTLAGAGYFDLLGMRLLRGRDFTAADNEHAQSVVVINETMAKRFWPEQDPVGRTFRVGDASRACDHTIIGVVRDARINDVREPAAPHMYLAASQSQGVGATLLVESVGDPLELAPVVRALGRAVDENLVYTSMTTLGLLVRACTQPQRNAVLVGVLLAALSLLLSAVGLYAVMSYSVRCRTRELGVRIALGAQAADVVCMIMQHGLILSASACLLGASFSLAVTPLISGVLYGVPPRDFTSHVAAASVLIANAALASWLPARRAAKVDPMEALRCE
jgi:putative ABC transport system permease protein